MEPQLQHARSWLCPEPSDRERLLEMDARLRKARGIAMAFLGGALLLCGPWVGWWTVFLLVGLATAWRLLDTRVPGSGKPEWWLAAGWLMSVTAIAIGVLGTGGVDSPAAGWFLVPVLTLPARFHIRGLYAGIAIAVVVMAAVTIASDPAQAAREPQRVVFPAALIFAAIAISMALRSAELQHRSAAVIDQLTGMLNRKALEARTVELEQQSKISGQPVGLVVCDIDHFKGVNDQYGHATGDAVLTDFAYRIRRELRAYDLAYRLGGEEFVILVPGATLDRTSQLAERLRVAVSAEPMQGIAVTASFGVAASGEEGLEFRSLFEEADEALYRAKAAGRNRVSTKDDAAFAILA